MTGYLLEVLHKGRPAPTASLTASRAAEVIDGISALLADHPDCHRIRVSAQGRFIFAVDCHGNTIHSE